MIFKFIGTSLKKNMKTRAWWAKLAVAIVLSNVFFFILFSGKEKTLSEIPSPEGWVELHVQGNLLTPFLKGKKVLLVNRSARKQVQATLIAGAMEVEGRITVLVKEAEAEILFKHPQWEILPYIKSLSFNPVVRGEIHEIRY